MFKNQKEIDDWIYSKVGDGCQEHPHQVHSSNWQLSEFWFQYDKGIDHQTKKTVMEKMDRVAHDGASACAALGMDENAKKKGLSCEEKHRLWFTKSKNLISKLSRAITNYEGQLPSFRRSTSGDTYARLKAGVNKCRLMKDDSLEMLEDQKGVTEFNEDMVQAMMDLHSRLAEHLDALVEAFKKHDQKSAPATPSDSSGLKLEAVTPGVPASPEAPN